MRVLALDIGQVRCGIAVSDAAEKVATPVCVLPMEEVNAHAASFRRVIEDWEPEMIVCGLPLTMSRAEGPQAKRIRTVADKVQRATGLPVEFADERLSSQEAKRILHEEGYKEREMRGKVDMIAASLTLQAWLDSRRNRREG